MIPETKDISRLLNYTSKHIVICWNERALLTEAILRPITRLPWSITQTNARISMSATYLLVLPRFTPGIQVRSRWESTLQEWKYHPDTDLQFLQHLWWSSSSCPLSTRAPNHSISPITRLAACSLVGPFVRELLDSPVVGCQVSSAHTLSNSLTNIHTLTPADIETISWRNLLSPQGATPD